MKTLRSIQDSAKAKVNAEKKQYFTIKKISRFAHQRGTIFHPNFRDLAESIIFMPSQSEQAVRYLKMIGGYQDFKHFIKNNFGGRTFDLLWKIFI